MIDAFEFARMASETSGALALIDLHRLDLVRRDGVLQWKVAGRTDSQRKRYLDLQVQGAVSMTCQRCLEPVSCPIDIVTRLLLVTGHAQADAEPLDEDAYDVLVASGALNISELVEDEVILALPLSPMHRDCSLPEAASQSGTRGRESVIQDARVLPFAGLRAKKGL